MKRLVGAACIALCCLFCACGQSTFTVESEPPTINSPIPGPESPTPPPEESPTPTPEPTPTPAASPAPTPSAKPEGTAALYRRPENLPAMPAVMADDTLTQKQKIDQIRAWYYETEGMGDKLTQRDYDENFSSWWYTGSLVKAEAREALDLSTRDGVRYFYYYHDGMPYFVYIVDKTNHAETRLYFWNGTLIRWLESDRVIHETENPAYAGYCDTAWSLYQTMLSLER